MKKTHSLILILFLFATQISFAQRPEQRIDPERLQAARIAFITSRIQLKPEQAEKFWPIFNQFQEKRETTMKQLGELNRGVSDVSEEEAKSRIQRKFQLQEKLISDEKVFVTEVSKVLSQKQILTLHAIGRDFTRHIYQRQRGEGND